MSIAENLMMQPKDCTGIFGTAVRNTTSTININFFVYVNDCSE